MQIPFKILSCAVTIGLMAGEMALATRKDGPTPLRRPKAEETSKKLTEVIANPSSYINNQEGYKFPASRPDIEKAASQCKEYVAGLYARRSEVPKYRLPYFQQMVGEAQERCDKLNQLVETIKLADEQLYTYQKSVQQAKIALEGKDVAPQSAIGGR